MNEIELLVSQLHQAQNGRDLIVENLLKNCAKIYRHLPREDKGNFLMQIGESLHQETYSALAMTSWNYALNYFTQNGDKKGEFACYTTIGNTNIN